jgi:hypothetical protein
VEHHWQAPVLPLHPPHPRQLNPRPAPGLTAQAADYVAERPARPMAGRDLAEDPEHPWPSTGGLEDELTNQPHPLPCPFGVADAIACRQQGAAGGAHREGSTNRRRVAARSAGPGRSMVRQQLPSATASRLSQCNRS